MEVVDSTLTKDEKRTRVSWLITYLGLSLYQWALPIYGLIHSEKKMKLMAYFSSHSALYLVAIPVLIVALQLYCVYVRPGTRWLNFLLLFIPLYLGMVIYKMIHFDPFLPSRYTTGITSVIAIAFFWFLTIKMRKINKRIQIQQYL